MVRNLIRTHKRIASAASRALRKTISGGSKSASFKRILHNLFQGGDSFGVWAQIKITRQGHCYIPPEDKKYQYLFFYHSKKGQYMELFHPMCLVKLTA